MVLSSINFYQHTTEELIKMKTNKNIPLFQLASLAIFALSPIASVMAEELQDNSSDPETELIIVTGTASRGVTALESSVAITTASSEDLAREVPLGIADALEMVPGFWVEDSGGEVSNNVAPRGLGGGAAFRFISIQEDGLPVFYDGLLTDTMQRIDLSINRFEAIRGGTSGVLTVNGAASIVNWISKSPDIQDGGAVKFSISDYNTFRQDFYYGGEVTDDWFLGVSGYYRSSDSIRDTGFNTDHGGQFRASLVRLFDDGQFKISYKNINERNTFLLPIPLQNVDDPEAIPGFDANTGTMLSQDNSVIRHFLPTQTYQTNLRDGFKTDASVLSMAFDWDFTNNWYFSQKSSFTAYDLAVNGVFNFDNSTLFLADERLEKNDVTALIDTFAQEGAIRAAYAYAATGELINNAQDLNGNGLVANSIALFRERSVEQILSDTRFNYEGDENNLAFGMLYAHMSLDREFQTSSTFLSEVKGQPSRIDIVALDAEDNVVGSLTDNGVLEYGTWFANNVGELTSFSFYANNEYQVSDSLRVDAGARYESVVYQLTAEAAASQQPLSGNQKDSILANDFAQNSGSGNFNTVEETFDELAWSIGFNYKLSDEFALYGRFSDAFQTPWLWNTNDITDGVSTMMFTEIGARYISDAFNGSATLFQTDFDNLALSGTVLATGAQETITAQTEAFGLEWELNWTPTNWLSLDALGVIQKTEISGIPETLTESAFNGSSVTRTPENQIRIVPTIHVTDNIDTFFSIHYIGKRFSDVANSLELPAYTTVDLGVSVTLSDNLSFQIKGSNLTNSIGLTEGNPRSGFTEATQSDFFYARPILGRAFTASVTYQF